MAGAEMAGGMLRTGRGRLAALAAVGILATSPAALAEPRPADGVPPAPQPASHAPINQAPINQAPSAPAEDLSFAWPCPSRADCRLAAPTPLVGEARADLVSSRPRPRGASISQAVPLPATLGLLGLGLAVLALVLRRGSARS